MNLPIIDTHQHLWDLDRFTVPWLPAEGPLADSHTMDRYLREAYGLNLAGTVYMEIDLNADQQAAEAEYVIDLCELPNNPMRAATIGGHPAEPQFAAYIERFAGCTGVRGVRQVLHNGNEHELFDNAKFLAGLRLLGDYGLHFDLCLKPTGINSGTRIVDSCPSTRFMLDHCGNGDVQGNDITEWKRSISEMSKRENVHCKISGIVVGAASDSWSASDLAPVVEHCAAAFGTNRIVFGSDWPVCTQRATYRQWLEALFSIISNWSEDEQRRLLHDNAVRFYRL